MSAVLSKKRERALLDFGKSLGVENISRRKTGSRMEIVVTVRNGQNAQETAHTFEEKFPELAFSFETIESAKFQHRVRHRHLGRLEKLDERAGGLA